MAKKFHKGYFANPGNFRVVIVGNVDVDLLKGLAEIYLASIPPLDTEITSIKHMY